MEAVGKARSPEAPEKYNWSILDGEFISSPDFPNEDEIKIIKGRSAIHPGELVQRRIYYTELLIYALKYVNHAVANNPDLIGQIRRGLIDQTVDLVYQMGDGRIEEPTGPSEEVPVMQALKAMQERGAFDCATRTMLDAIVRGVHIKQTGAKL